MKKYIFSSMLALSMSISSSCFAIEYAAAEGSNYAYNSGNACAAGYELDKNGNCVKSATSTLVWGCAKGSDYFYNGECQQCPKIRPYWDGSKCCEKLDSKTGKCPDSTVTAALKCGTSQYVVQDKCVACPKWASCDGENANCPGDYTKDAKGNVACKGCGTGYMNASTNKCVTTCPKNAVCDGWTVICKSGYVNEYANLDGGKINCVSATAIKCKENQYLLYDKCTACPADATCDGRTATCRAGFVQGADKISGVVCLLNMCKANQYVANNKCTACPANATCNGKTATCKTGYYNIVKGPGDVVICEKDPLTCKTNQYVANNKCATCPANATCNGKTATCKTGYARVVKDGVVSCALKSCKTNQYIVGTTCVACPKGATCDGKNPKCPNGYTKDAKGYVICKTTATCKSSQYLVNKKCTACPKNAKCNGQTATCKSGYAKTTKNGVVTCMVKQCEKGSHTSIEAIKKANKGCTKCRTENVAAGKCAKNKKAHRHYYCNCNC